MPLVIVASTNPVKINSIAQAFKQMFPDVEHLVQGVGAPSGVPDQPMGTDEIILGARNRVQHARKDHPEADYVAGIEGGLITDENEQLVNVAWIVIVDKAGHESKTSTGTFVLPKSMAEDIRGGLEMGLAAKKLYDLTNAKQNPSAVGVLTSGVIDRTSYYTHAAILALIPFKNLELYSS